MPHAPDHSTHPFAQIPELLAARAGTIRNWLAEPITKRLGMQVLIIVVGAGIYGATLGLWRSPLQALYVAIKFPLILLLTATFNAGLNGMLAQLLGLKVRFLDSFRLIVMSFATAALILAGFSPLTLFALHNAPPLDDPSAATREVYSAILLMHVVAIAFAGVMANVKLFQSLRSLAGDRGRAQFILLAWLGGNLLLGGQFVWNLRPFIGAPFLPVQFLRPTAFEGNFFEGVYHAIHRLLTS
ncbi:MAG TPA: hypothetical protein DCY13_08730 [Verrucomicrobiales bacterium]|nr:hypothetical protein [Verrucomicrobiales bacterium]